jgi:hypothetical protein
MKLAWFLMVVGALCIFQGIALIFTGSYVNSFWIIFTGFCVGIGMGIFPLRYGYNRRKEILAKRKVRE